MLTSALEELALHLLHFVRRRHASLQLVRIWEDLFAPANLVVVLLVAGAGLSGVIESLK